MFFHFGEESSLKGESQIGIAKMSYNTPETIIREATFSKETVNIWIPFKRLPESMKDANKAGNKVLRFVFLKNR